MKNWLLGIANTSANNGDGAGSSVLYRFEKLFLITSYR